MGCRLTSSGTLDSEAPHSHRHRPGLGVSIKLNQIEFISHNEEIFNLRIAAVEILILADNMAGSSYGWFLRSRGVINGGAAALTLNAATL